MSYFLDTQSGDSYFASVVLTNASHPDRPPLVVRVEDLMREQRFLPVSSTWEAGLRGLQVADTSGRVYRRRLPSPE